MHIAEPVVEAERVLFTVPAPRVLLEALGVAGETMVAELAQPLGEARVPRGDDAALGAGYRLHRVEAEHSHVGMSTIADRLAGGDCAERLRRILDQADL